MSAILVSQDLARLQQLYTDGFHDSFLDNALRKMKKTWLPEIRAALWTWCGCLKLQYHSQETKTRRNGRTLRVL
jgi:hypothetical protein